MSQFSIPEDLVEFVNSYAFSNKETECLDVSYSTLDFPSHLSVCSSSDIPGSNISSPLSSEESRTKPSRMHRVADKDRQSNKRKLNRDAAFRYRQKVKAKNEKLQGELAQAIRAFSDARKQYESARDAFDALKKVVLDMGIANVIPRF